MAETTRIQIKPSPEQVEYFHRMDTLGQDRFQHENWNNFVIAQLQTDTQDSQHFFVLTASNYPKASATLEAVDIALESFHPPLVEDYKLPATGTIALSKTELDILKSHRLATIYDTNLSDVRSAVAFPATSDFDSNKLFNSIDLDKIARVFKAEIEGNTYWVYVLTDKIKEDEARTLNDNIYLSLSENNHRHGLLYKLRKIFSRFSNN